MHLTLHHASSFSSILSHVTPTSLLLLCSDPTPALSSTPPALTLSVLSQTSATRVVILPSIPHLRAYLTTLGDETGVDSIIVWGLLEAHRDTEDGLEWTAQGLGRTLGSLVEAIGRYEGKVRGMLVEWDEDDGNGEKVMWDLMDVDVLRGGGGGTVEIRRVLERWGICGEDWVGDTAS